MTQRPSQDQFDIDCLRLIATDPEARRVSLSAAMIKLHALTIARREPDLHGEAMEIVRHLESLYAGLPDRAALSRVVRDHAPSARFSERAVEDLVDAVWAHFRAGRD